MADYPSHMGKYTDEEDLESWLGEDDTEENEPNAVLQSYPPASSLAPSDRLTCQAPGCGQTYQKFKFLFKHLIRNHGCTDHGLRQHWIGAAHNREHAKGEAEISDTEFSHVTLAYRSDGTVDEKMFTCLKCNTTMNKTSCLVHMGKHKQDSDAVNAWLCNKDVSQTPSGRAPARLPRGFRPAPAAWDNRCETGSGPLWDFRTGLLRSLAEIQDRGLLRVPCQLLPIP